MTCTHRTAGLAQPLTRPQCQGQLQCSLSTSNSASTNTNCNSDAATITPNNSKAIITSINIASHTSINHAKHAAYAAVWACTQPQTT